MQNLKATSDTLSHEEIAETLLAEAGVFGSLPTDEGKILEFLRLKQMSFDFGQEPDFVQMAPNIPQHLRAALSVNDRIVVTHSQLGAKRSRWSVFHEVAHFILPEHLDKLFLDTDQSLSLWTKKRLEREANSVAAEMLFQGEVFSEEAHDMALSCRTVLDLAPKYDASYESAMRRYVERHILPCAVIVYEKLPDVLGDDPGDDKYRIHYTVTSDPFRKKFFSGVQSTEDFSRGSDIFRVHGSWNIGNIVEAELEVERANEKPWRFQTELFTNSYKIFQFIHRPVGKAAEL